MLDYGIENKAVGVNALDLMGICSACRQRLQPLHRFVSVGAEVGFLRIEIKAADVRQMYRPRCA